MCDTVSTVGLYSILVTSGAQFTPGIKTLKKRYIGNDVADTHLLVPVLKEGKKTTSPLFLLERLSWSKTTRCSRVD